MADIININIGQFGLRIGQQFWQQIEIQHQIRSNKPKGNLTFFQQTQKQYRNRSIFVDLQTKEMDKIRSSKNLHSLDNLISIDSASTSTYGQAYYSLPFLIEEEIQNNLRKTIQLCDNFSGVVLCGAMAGGTGSGVYSKLIQNLRNTYPRQIFNSYRLAPEPKRNTTPIQIYNSVFSINFEVQNIDLSILLNNSAVDKNVAKTNYYYNIDDSNQFIGKVITQITAPMRFGGSLNASLRKIATNLVLFPRMHFLCPSITNNKCSNFANPFQSTLKQESFLIKNYLSKMPNGTIFSVHAHLRDNYGYEGEVSSLLLKQFEIKNYKFIDWMQNNLHISISNQLSLPSASLLINSYHFGQILKEFSQSFSQIWRRKGFVHNYTGAGMDEMQFVEAQSNLNDLHSQYTPNFYFGDIDQELDDDDDDL